MQRINLVKMGEGSSMPSNWWNRVKALYEEHVGELATKTKEEIVTVFEVFETHLLEQEAALEELREEYVEQESELYPGHLFKRGGWRVTGGANGFNAVAGMLAGMDLEDVFRKDEFLSIEYKKPDWEDAREQAQLLVAQMKRAAEDFKNVNVFEVPHGERMRVRNKGEALSVFRSEMEREGAGGDRDNRHGVFFEKGLVIKGLVRGEKYDAARGESVPATYVVYETELEEGRGTYDWYVEAAEIVLETIEWVLEQENPSQYVMRWW